MNHYEILYIIHPALQAGHLDDTIKTVSEKIEHFKGKVLIQSNWGKKKLAYLIQKQKFGTYVLTQCHLDGKHLSELNGEFEHNANIMRHLIISINEDDVSDEKNTSSIPNNSADRPVASLEKNNRFQIALRQRRNSHCRP